MGRGKLPLRLIPKERARKITFAKRKSGLLKKAYELSTLCDVKVCVIVYDTTNKLSPNVLFITVMIVIGSSSRGDIPLYTWPEEPQEVESLIAKYLAYKAKNPVSKRDLDLTDFFKEKIKKIQHETKNIMVMNHKSSYHHHDQFDFLWDNRIDGFSLTQLHDLMIHLDKRISEADKHCTDFYNNKSNNNMMIMCVTPHDRYYDIDHHHQNNYQFGSTSGAVSPLKMMVQDHHIGSSFQTTSSDYHHDYNYNINNNQVCVYSSDCNNNNNNNNPQYNYSRCHDQPAASSSSKTVPFGHHPSGSFMSMMLNSHEQTDHNEDSGQHYSNLMNIGSTMFNNNNTIGTSAITGGMTSTDHDYVVIHRQNGVFLNNRPDIFGCSAAHGSGYSPAGNQFRSNNSQQVVKFCDKQLHGFGKAPAAF